MWQPDTSIILRSNLLTLCVPDEGYIRIASSALDCFSMRQFQLSKQKNTMFSTQFVLYYLRLLGDDMYTLVMVDPYGTSATHLHPYINWMVLDIPHGNVNAGLTVREYKGPQPSRSSGVHTYYFLLYKQMTNVNTSSVSSYTTTCSR